MYFEIRKYKAYSFIFLSQDFFWIQGALRFYMNFRMDFSISTIGILMRITLNLWVNLGSVQF